MKKTSFPLLALLALVVLFLWITKHRNGRGEVTATGATEAYSALRSGNKTLVYSRHARCRMDCRHIDESEVKEILQEGDVNFSKIEHSEKGNSYPVEGKTHDGQHVRIVFAPHEEKLVVVTVIDLDTEWKCDCP